MHILFAQIHVKPLCSYLHKAGFLVTWVMCVIILFTTSCPNYAQLLTKYHLELLYSDEAHPAGCAMLETWAMSIRRTNKPFFRTPVDWNLEQIVPMLMFHPD